VLRFNILLDHIEFREQELSELALLIFNNIFASNEEVREQFI